MSWKTHKQVTKTCVYCLKPLTGTPARMYHVECHRIVEHERDMKAQRIRRMKKKQQGIALCQYYLSNKGWY